MAASVPWLPRASPSSPPWRPRWWFGTTWRNARCFDNDGLRPWDLSRRQLRAFADAMNAGTTPVLVEHDPARRVGRIVRAATDPVSGGLAVEMQFDRPLPSDLRELSLRHDCGDNATGEASVWPVEVSVVREGARRDCRLLRDVRLEDVLARMATDPVQAPESMAAEPEKPAVAQMSGAELVEAAANNMPGEQAQALMDVFGEMAKARLAAESDASDMKRQMELLKRNVDDLNAAGAREFEQVFAGLRNQLPDNALDQDTVRAILEIIGEKPDVRQHVQTLVSACASAITGSGGIKRRRERSSDEGMAAPQTKIDPAMGRFPAWLMEACNSVRPGDTVSADQLGLGKGAARGV